MNKILVITWCCFMLSCLSGCKKKPAASRNQALWSSENPFTIPLRQRLNKFEKGNLVFNASFESGKYFFYDTDNNAYVIDGWKETSKNVKWIENKDSANSHHYIKITREHADVTDETGEGVISDFIRVIPGNYMLNYDIKLKNIVNPKSRLGTRLYDAIDIRIYYYDKNKLQVDGRKYLPFIPGKVDQTFKGYPFSAFWAIDSIGWTRVTGRTYHYPYDEGNIPDEARFVKIFIGLKGSGIMHLDNVDFRYTEANFSQLERLNAMMNKTLSPWDLLVPAPQFLQAGERFHFFDPEDIDKFPVIVIPGNAGQLTRKSAELLKEKIENLLQAENKEIRVKILTRQPENVSHVFRINDKEIITNTDYPNIPSEIFGNKETYSLFTNYEEHSTFLSSPGQEGIFHGINTLLKLFEDTGYIYNSCQIFDFPDFSKRGCFLHADSSFTLQENIDKLVSYHFNNFYVFENLNNETETFKAIQNEPYQMNVLMENLNNFESVKELKDRTNRFLNKGYKGIVIHAGTLPWTKNGFGFNYYHRPVKELVELQKRDIHFLGFIKKFIDQNYNDRELKYISPYYHNERVLESMGNAETYFTGLSMELPVNISFVWSGICSETRCLDNISIEYYKQLTGRYPIYLNNTLYSDLKEEYIHLYPGKARSGSLFSPASLSFPTGHQSRFDGGEVIIYNESLSRLEQVKLQVTAAGLWNHEEFNPDITLWKILVNDYGKYMASRLIMFNDAYLALKGDLAQKSASRREARQEAITRAHYQKMLNYFEELKLNVNDQQLMQELSYRVKTISEKFESRIKTEPGFFVDTFGAGK